MGGTGGGVWKSTNAAVSAERGVFPAAHRYAWRLHRTDAVSLRIGALTVQPGGTGVILAGMDDPNDASDSYYGASILRAADGGVTRSLIVPTNDTVSGTSVYFRLLREQLCRLRLEHQ
jgi:hypothetical protein